MPNALRAQSKTPHVVAVCLANAAAGIAQLTTGSLPSSIAATAPPYIAHMWSVLLAAGGIVALIGIFIKPTVLGLRLEAAGHVGIFGGCIVYAVSTVTWMSPPWWPSPAVWWSVFIALASAWRWMDIWKTIRRAEKIADKAIVSYRLKKMSDEGVE